MGQDSRTADPRMSGVRVPHDEEAEEVVAGCAVASAHGAALAAGRVVADDFYTPRLQRLFEAAVELVDVESEADRISFSAARAGVPEADVRSLVRARPVMHDSAGSFARRVRDAARRRAVMFAATDVLERLGRGEPLAEVLPILEGAL